MPGFQGSVLTRASFAVVPVANDDPLDSIRLVLTGDGRNGTVFTGHEVPDLVGLSVLGIHGTDKHVVGDVVKVSTILQPGSGHCKIRQLVSDYQLI